MGEIRQVPEEIHGREIQDRRKRKISTPNSGAVGGCSVRIAVGAAVAAAPSRSSLASAEIMSLIAPDGPVYQAGTLSGNPVAMAAGIQTLETIRQNGFYDDIELKSKYFIKELEKIISNKGITVHSIGSMFTLFFNDNEIKNFEDVKDSDSQRFSKFFNQLLENGVYISPSQFEANFISMAHSKPILNKTLEIIDKVLKTI